MRLGGMRRPGPLLWLRYALGMRLPEQYATWVLFDTTARTWLLRHVARVAALIAVPSLLILFLLPTSWATRGVTLMAADGSVLVLMLILAPDATERRCTSAGFRWGTAADARAARSGHAQRATAQRYRERMAARAAARPRTRLVDGFGSTLQPDETDRKRPNYRP
jgi:hypothetical protein